MVEMLQRVIWREKNPHICHLLRYGKIKNKKKLNKSNEKDILRDLLQSKLEKIVVLFVEN